MHTKRNLVATAAAVIVVLAVSAGCGGSNSKQGGVPGAEHSSSTLVGAGSTLVAPLVARWETPYRNAHGVTVTYNGIGSGGGIQSITSRIVDFGASDAPLTADQARSCKGCVQIPWALAATTVSYNVAGLSKPLNLSGPVIAGMYLGQVKTWNDPRIRRLNPGVKLPSTAVHPVYRSDASGDTYAFTDFLSHASPAWKSKIGISTSVSWPTGSGAPKNAGMAALIESTPGAVGYVAIGQAVGSKLHYANIENRAKTFVRPSTTTIAAAAKTARFTKRNTASIVDPPGSASNAYPISTFTYAIVPRTSSKLRTLRTFLTYAVMSGQQFAAELQFAPLPQNVVAKDRSVINGL